MTEQQSLDLQGKTALVTNGSFGVGRAICLHLAARGAAVFVNGPGVNQGVQVVEEIELSGGTANYIAADLTSFVHPLLMADLADQVDILVNNAGFFWFGASAALDVGSLDPLFVSTGQAAFLVGTTIGPAMAARGTGTIINVSTMQADDSIASVTAYEGAKAAMSALTRTWAADLGPSGVRVNAIAAGAMRVDGMDAQSASNVGARTMLERAPQLEEFAEVVGFLASSRSSYITGATIAVDGGRSMT